MSGNDASRNALEQLQAIAQRRDRPANDVWPAAAAAIELLWWHDQFDDAMELAHAILRDFADAPSTFVDYRGPFADAILAATGRQDEDPRPALTEAKSCVPVDSVLGRHLGWLISELAARRPYELLPGYDLARPVQPLKPRDQQLADREATELSEDERYRLYSATHSRRQFPIAAKLFAATGEYPSRWYVATWMAGEFVDHGKIELATTFLMQALPDWIPFEAWDIVPTTPVLQPRLRPAVTEAFRQQVLSNIDISKIPGVVP